MIPLRVQFDAEPWAKNFNVKWTPTIITLDYDGNEHHRTVGFLNKAELTASLLLGMAKIGFDHDQFNLALEHLNNLLTDFSTSNSVPEAIYLHGVSRYKQTHDPVALKSTYEKLRGDFPDSEWTQRAYPYRLL